MEMDELRQMPYSLEAEQAVLGSVLINPECFKDVAVILKTRHFYISQHKEIYEIMLHMFESGMTIDIVTLLDELKVRGVYDEAGGKSYLLQLAEMVPSTANVGSYAKIVEEKANLRQMIEAAQDIVQSCYEQGDDIRTIMDRAEQRIYDIMGDRANTGFESIKTLILGIYDRLQKLASDDREEYLGTKTYFRDVDRMLVGMNNSDLILIAARPGVGKTSFVLNIAENVAEHKQKEIVVFSLEMSKEQIVSRMLASEAELDSVKLRTGELTAEDWVKLAEAAGRLSKYQIMIDDTASITVTEMKAKLRRLKNLGLVVIDYIQLMTSGSRRSEGRTQEISEISRSLKIMARELNVPILALSQLSRGPESRQDHRPMLSDLRESGAIEQDADMVMFLYRDELYNPDTERKNIAECIIAKNRHGSTGVAELYWRGLFTRFYSLEKVLNDH